MFHVNLITKIQKRLAVILLNLPHRHIKKKDKEAHVPRAKFDDLLINTSHCIQITSTRMQCVKCLSNFSKNDPTCKYWLTTRCMPEASADNAPQVLHKPIPITQPIHKGNQISHSSHSLNNYRGIIYCSKCGARSGKNQIRYIARPCEPPTDTGRRFLANIRNGLLPSGCTEWPKQL